MYPQVPTREGGDMKWKSFESAVSYIESLRFE
jgi:hypothetical protein